VTEKDKASDSEFQSIAPLENAIEGQLIASILSEQGIPHRIRSFHDTAYDGLYQFQKGWGMIMAPESWRQAILEILERVRSDAEASE
jgi:hypothetical protein